MYFQSMSLLYSVNFCYLRVHFFHRSDKTILIYRQKHVCIRLFSQQYWYRLCCRVFSSYDSYMRRSVCFLQHFVNCQCYVLLRLSRRVLWASWEEHSSCRWLSWLNVDLLRLLLLSLRVYYLFSSLFENVF